MLDPRTHRSVVAVAMPLLVPGGGQPPSPVPWGSRGHEMAAEAAVAGLPAEMPAFFRQAGRQIVYLNPEPDRWREDASPEMNEAFRYDHYIDLENVPPGALDARDRYEFLAALYRAGTVEKPERDVGFLPFRILELYQRLVVELTLWRAESDPEVRGWIEQRVIHDAGILGHYVTDAAQPHHTTIHFNGWARSSPNPHGYTEDRTFHERFEARFVSARVRPGDVASRMPSGVRALDDVRTAVVAHILESHGQVETLYRLERDHGFHAGSRDPETRDFAVDRLVAGAAMLRDLWWTAWLESWG